MTDESLFNALVTGGAGFVGSHLVDRLIDAGAHVTVYDALPLDNVRLLDKSMWHANFDYVHGDLADQRLLTKMMAGTDIVFHLAANADIRHNTEDPSLSFRINTEGTRNVLEAMRVNNVKKIMLASTGAVYGNPKQVPTPEDCPFPIQNSLYGASKVAAEGLVTAYCEAFNMQSWILRFVPMLGERYSHGHIFDFVKKLTSNPRSIELFGDGTERKSSLYVHDAISAIFDTVFNQRSGKINIFNVCNDASYSMYEAIGYVAKIMGAKPQITYKNSTWVGDNPNMQLDTAKLRLLDWRPTCSPSMAIFKTVTYLLDNSWMLERD